MSAPHGRSGSDHVLVDFDGTFAGADVGNRFFRHFTEDTAAWTRLLEDWRHERVSARECLARECDLARAREAEARAFIEEFALAEGAVEMVAAATAAGHRVEIVSDGLSFYIERLLARAGLEVPFSANQVSFDGGALVPRFGSLGPAVRLASGAWAEAAPGAGEGCGACGNCKGARVDAARASGARRVLLVGDGFSDRCAAGRADVVYAKDELLAWCRERGIAAKPFARLADVVSAEGWNTTP